MRGDGNCFYRAMLTAELERCFRDKAELDRFTTLCKGWRQTLFDFGFPELTTGDFCDAMETLMESIGNGTKTLGFLFDDLSADGIANYYVAFTRLICSGYLRQNEVLYSGFIEGERTLDQFCKDEVEPMWREADHICIIALVNAMSECWCRIWGVGGVGRGIFKILKIHRFTLRFQNSRTLQKSPSASSTWTGLMLPTAAGTTTFWSTASPSLGSSSSTAQATTTFSTSRKTLLLPLLPTTGMRSQ